jgi:hypothetical protein
VRLLLLLLLCFATATSASAQTTWHGLHFGESRDDVRSQLAAQNMPVETSPDGALQTNTDYNLPLPGLLYPFPMVANLHFDTNSLLADVTLTLDLPAMRRDWASLGSDQALYNFADDQLTFALAGLYGAPLYSSVPCNVIAETASFPCTILWRGNQQSIELERLSSGRRLRIHYLPLATGL